MLCYCKWLQQQKARKQNFLQTNTCPQGKQAARSHTKQAPDLISNKNTFIKRKLKTIEARKHQEKARSRAVLAKNQVGAVVTAAVVGDISAVAWCVAASRANQG